MKTRIIQASQGPDGFNHGKFLIGRFDHEWEVPSKFMPSARGVIAEQGWTGRHLLVMDLATGEGALFPVDPRSYAKADLDKKCVHVCILFEAFLTWLYEQAPIEFDKLPDFVELPGIDPAMFGYRRDGGAAARLHVLGKIIEAMTDDEKAKLTEKLTPEELAVVEEALQATT